MPNGKPNILVIWGDDIGITNLSRYSDGPDGATAPRTSTGSPTRACGSTDSYGEQSCTAGRVRVHHRPERRTAPCLSKLGMPGVDVGPGRPRT